MWPWHCVHCVHCDSTVADSIVSGAVALLLQDTSRARMSSGLENILARSSPSVSLKWQILNLLLLSQYKPIRACLHFTGQRHYRLINQSINQSSKLLFLSQFIREFPLKTINHVTGLSPWETGTDVPTLCVNTVQTPSADLWDMTCEPVRAAKREKGMHSLPPSHHPRVVERMSSEVSSHPANAAVCTTGEGLVIGIFITAQRIPTEPPTCFCKPVYQDNLQIQVKTHPMLSLTPFIRSSSDAGLSLCS